MLMVAHDNPCRTLVNHAPGGFERLELLGASVDEVAEEDDGSVRAGVTVGAVSEPVAEFFEQFDKSVVVTVDVS
jgi:hypothetical protein